MCPIFYFQYSKQKEVLECLQIGRVAEKYSPNVRLFCLTVHFYSPRAYEYIRSYFNLNLPHIRTIRNWYSVINGSPGFTESSFSALKKKQTRRRQRIKNLMLR